MELYNYKAKVVRVVDGDTVRMDINLGFGIIMSNESVRLVGIDAPESRTRDLVEKEKGLASKDFLISLLPVGTDIIVQTTLDKSGKYGRVLGVLVKDQVNLNELMVAEGLAVVYNGGKR